MHAGQTDNDTNRSKWLTRPAGGHAKPPSRSLGGRVLDVGIKQSWKQRKCADQKSFRLSHSFCTTRSPSFESLFLPVQELNNNLIATMRATPLLIAIATLLSLTFASAVRPVLPHPPPSPQSLTSTAPNRRIQHPHPQLHPPHPHPRRLNPSPCGHARQRRSDARSHGRHVL